ncbi:MAG: hypothetical protein IK093_02530 [Ruminiclostridium sp.]|nr:hypothetical protein [Ruminiclostridium sp.]
MEELQKTTTTEQDKDIEIMKLFGQIDHNLIPIMIGYMRDLAEQDKRQKIRELRASGAIHNANDTMKLLSHQPLDLDRFNKMVPEILDAFKETLTVDNFDLYFSVYYAGVIDGIGRERKRRRRETV